MMSEYFITLVNPQHTVLWVNHQGTQDFFTTDDKGAALSTVRELQEDGIVQITVITAENTNDTK